MRLLFIFFFVVFSQNWNRIDHILNTGINDKVFPGCVAIVGSQNRKLYSKSFGRFKYDEISPKMTEDVNYFFNIRQFLTLHH